ncbi:hypothetical protein FA10DRAFT_285347 [Acaromyces ingoldii]|uniref:TFIIE beta domain-containing protein n=1 Tax=Acaromyces ingoldii TaxID=215250 RepID=A0A316YTC9_9BASI|nr:hypothetical protein FA10DRAFT_285347 [Acaromyces ingoldii]PWN92481.1 hypothetical protein FA10DRAFT_285347 [Acaromyces ingoldii]
MATIHSQPANTGAGRYRATKIDSFLSALRSERSPVSLDDFAIRHSLEAILSDPELQDILKAHDRVIYNDRNKTWAWRPDYNVRTPADVLKLIEGRFKDSVPPLVAGFRLSELRESYPQVREVVEANSKRPAPETRRVSDEDGRRGEEDRDEDEEVSREEQKKLLLLTNPAKENSIKLVFWNEASSSEFLEANGGRRIESVDEEFRELWHSLPVPEPVDMYKYLAEKGLSAAQAAQSASQQAAANASAMAARGRGRGRGSSRGSGRGRKVRIQNTHIEGIDISRNYQQP